MKLEELAEALEKSIGVERDTLYMAYEEALFLGSSEFAIHLCNKHLVTLIMVRTRPGEAELIRVGFGPSRAPSIPLDILGGRGIHVSKKRELVEVMVDVESIDDAVSLMHRVLGGGMLELRECGYEVLGGREP